MPRQSATAAVGRSAGMRSGEKAPVTVHGRGMSRHRAGGRLRRSHHCRARATARRHGRVSAARHARHPAAWRVPLPRRVRRAGSLVHVHRRVHQSHADRRVPGAGRPEATYTFEHSIDALARKVGIDPVEIRRRNFIPTDKLPVRVGARIAVRLRELRRRARSGRSTYSLRQDLRADHGAAAPRGTTSTSGSGCRATSRCAASRRAGAPSRVAELAAADGGRDVRVLPTGKVQVVTGTSPHGQGHETCGR